MIVNKGDKMNVRKGILIILLIGVLLFLTIPGCAREGDDEPDLSIGTPGENPDDELQIPIGTPSDYFPIDTGREWTYEIKIGGSESIYYYETSWPLGEGRLVQSTTGRFMPLLEDGPPKSFLLKIRVKGPAAQQGPLEYPTGVELKIEEDELGIFEYHEEVFWAITNSQGFMAQQVVTFAPDTLGAPTGTWGSWGQEKGYSIRLLLFGEEPGIGIGFENSPDILYFNGIETDVPDYREIPCLHFQRVVNLKKLGDEDETGYTLNKDFTEDTWFAKGIGLVRLEQKVEGKSSMTWILK